MICSVRIRISTSNSMSVRMRIRIRHIINIGKGIRARTSIGIGIRISFALRISINNSSGTGLGSSRAYWCSYRPGGTTGDAAISQTPCVLCCYHCSDCVRCCWCWCCRCWWCCCCCLVSVGVDVVVVVPVVVVFLIINTNRIWVIVTLISIPWGACRSAPALQIAVWTWYECSRWVGCAGGTRRSSGKLPQNFWNRPQTHIESNVRGHALWESR